MNHFYIGLTLSLICLLLIYLSLPTFLLVAVLCVILAGLYFKDDYVIFRYIETHVASFYSWICEFFLGIQNMYHQSNNTSFPIRKNVENNGVVTRKFDRLHHGSSYNLSTPFAMDNKPTISGIWDSGSKFPTTSKGYNNRAQTTLQQMSKLNISHNVRGNSSPSDYQHPKSNNSSGVSPLSIAQGGYSRSNHLSKSGSSPFPASQDHPSNIENKPPLSAKLYADVSSPGFCGRVADRLHEENMTHQSKYDTVGAFPVINLKSQSPKIKIKTPVRVRLAPPSNEVLHYNYGANTLSRTPVVGSEDSMKSVLQVLKEISRKRIHSHIDEDSEEGTKRLRVTDSQLDSDGLLHTSLLQQTIQGKRAREESSPNEDDKKRRKASLKNNEILSSLSSSISIRPPHLQTAKRKAHSIDDSITSTPVLGKLLKVQTEVTPPPPTNHIAAPDSHVAVPKVVVQESTAKTSTPSVPSPIVPPPVAQPEPTKPPVAEPPAAVTEAEDGAVSRLLGRMSDQTRARPIDIPVKRNVFMTTNDLSLSPPKENRLAAMIAVLGGPSEQSELENIEPETPREPERLIKGKALFMSPETPATPDTPKQNKKVTFSDSLTTTKIFERDESDNRSSTTDSSSSLAPPSIPLSSTNTTPTGPKLNFASQNTSEAKPFALNFGSPLSSGSPTPKLNENTSVGASVPLSNGASSDSSSANQTSMFKMQPSNQSFPATPSTTNVSLPTFSAPATVSSSSLVNTPSPGGFSFGTNNSLTNFNKESSPKENTSSPSRKPFSFGSDSKTSQPATSVSGFPSLFAPVASKNETTKAANVENAVGQSKPMFNIFGSKDSSNTTNKLESKDKPLVNGFAPTSSSSSPFALSQPASVSKPPSFTSNANPTTTQSPSPFSFGSTTAFSTSSSASLTTQQSTPSLFTSTNQQANLTNTSSFQPSSQPSTATPSLNIFNSSTSSPGQNKPSAFGSGMQAPPAFGDSIFKPIATNSQTSQANSMFGSTPSLSSGFGSSPALQNGAVSSTSGTSQGGNMFGNVSSTANKPFGSDPSTTTQPSTTPMFGFSGTTASTQASSPFGITLNNSTTNATTMFGNTTTAQSTSVFGSSTTSIGSQSSGFPTLSTTAGQPSLFGVANNDASKNMFAGAIGTSTSFGGMGSTPSLFGSQSNSTPTFGGQNTNANTTPPFGGQNTTAAPTFGGQNTSAAPTFGGQNTSAAPTFGGQNTAAAPTFGGQNTAAAPTFGGQNTTAAPSFGNQSAPAFSFGSQNNTSNPTQGGFASSGTFGGNSSSSSTNEVKPPAFSSGSPFMFGSSAANKPAEAVKPLGSASPFTFGSTAQTNSSANLAQPSVPSFGAPTPTFGASQPAPTFGAPTTSQPAAPTFQFGQASSAPAPAFQFNAAPPTVGGGMFSIGSGGSSTSRAKTTALRRSHKRT